jgi:hypothetical protein
MVGEPEKLHSRARSLNEQDLHENLAYFKVPQEDIESSRSKLALGIFLHLEGDDQQVAPKPQPGLTTELTARINEAAL